MVAAAALTVTLATPALANWGAPSVTSTVSTGTFPNSVTLTPNESRLLVTNFISDSMSILDTSSMTGTTLATNVGPWDVAVNPGGTRAWLSEYGTGSSGTTVAEIDLTVTPPVVLRRLTVGNGPTGVAVTPNGNEVWVANYSLSPFTTASVSVIDATATPPVVAATLTGMGDNPTDIAFNGDGTRALVTTYTGTPNVRLVNVATRAVVGSLAIGSGLESVAFSADGTRAWVAGGNQVHLLSISGNTVTLLASATSNGASRVVVSPDGGRAWVSNYFGATVNIFDALTLAPASGSPLTVGTNPIGLAFSASGTTAYVTNSGSNNLSVVSTGWIPGGGDPSQYPTAPEQAFQVPFGTNANECGALAPDTVDWPGIRHLRTQSWSISYAQWPNDHQGGWVCTRQPFWNGAGWAIR